jgi:hypothetical protein
MCTDPSGLRGRLASRPFVNVKGCQVTNVGGVFITTGCGSSVVLVPRKPQPAPPRPKPGNGGKAILGGGAAAAIAKCIESGLCNPDGSPKTKPGGGGETTTTTPRTRNCLAWDDSDGLLRGMKSSGDSPVLGSSGRTLGARLGTDLSASPNGTVRPGTGGMSVAPESPMNLPEHRRPAECGGTGADPVWKISKDGLGPDLQYRPDPTNPTGHGFVEPVRPLSFQQYQQALHSTANSWIKLP